VACRQNTHSHKHTQTHTQTLSHTHTHTHTQRKGKYEDPFLYYSESGAILHLMFAVPAEISSEGLGLVMK